MVVKTSICTKLTHYKLFNDGIEKGQVREIRLVPHIPPSITSCSLRTDLPVVSPTTQTLLDVAQESPSTSCGILGNPQHHRALSMCRDPLSEQWTLTHTLRLCHYHLFSN